MSNNAFSYNRLSAAGTASGVSGGSNSQMPLMSSHGLGRSDVVGSAPTRMSLDTLVNDIMTSVKGTKGYWTKLPYILCQNPEVGSGKESVEHNCWNGRERGSYGQRMIGDGLAAQDQNPEVQVDSSIADTDINEQIFALRLVINKLESAYNGHTVKWPHYEASKYFFPQIFQ
jgi:glypican 4 (K-glypican)